MKEQRVSLATHFLFARVRILAEHFYLIETKFPITQKKPDKKQTFQSVSYPAAVSFEQLALRATLGILAYSLFSVKNMSRFLAIHTKTPHRMVAYKQLLKGFYPP